MTEGDDQPAGAKQSTDGSKPSESEIPPPSPGVADSPTSIARAKELATSETKSKRVGRWSSVAVTLASGIFALLGAGIGAGSSYLINNENIKSQRDAEIHQFKRDQERDAYADILKQATNLRNVSQSTGIGLAFNPALALAKAGTAPGPGQGVVPPAPSTQTNPDTTIILGPDIKPQPGNNSMNDLANAIGNITQKDRDIFNAIAPERKQYQDAFNALDNSIANAQLFSTPKVIAIAIALRDRYSDDFRVYLDKLTDIGTYLGDDSLARSQPKPPYDFTFLEHSPEELTAMFVAAAQQDLDINSN